MHKNSYPILIYVYWVIVMGCSGSTHYGRNKNYTRPYVLVEQNQNNRAIVQQSLENVKHTYDAVQKRQGTAVSTYITKLALSGG
jgi:hypothetical protein